MSGQATFELWFDCLQDEYIKVFTEALSLDRDAARDYYNDGYSVDEYMEVLKNWN